MLMSIRLQTSEKKEKRSSSKKPDNKQKPSTNNRLTLTSAESLDDVTVLESDPSLDMEYLYTSSAISMAHRKNRTWLQAFISSFYTRMKDYFGRYSPSYTLRRKVSIIMSSSQFGNTWDIFQVLLSVATCFLYVVGTYYPSTSQDPADLLDWSVTILFIIDYLLRWYISNNRFTYPFGFFAIIDLLACLPVIISWVLLAGNIPTFAAINILRVVRVFRVLRIIRTFKMLNASLDPVTEALFTVTFTVICLIFIGAGVFHLLEQELYTAINSSIREEYDGNPANPGSIYFLDAAYYMVVTLFTIGYGDFYPITASGRMFLVFLILSAIVLIPIQLNGLSEALVSRSIYTVAFDFDPIAPHVIILGSSETNRQTTYVSEFIDEFMHIERTSSMEEQNSHIIATVVSNMEPSPEIIKWMDLSDLSDRLKYIKASVFVKADRDRVAMSNCDAVFIFSEACIVDPVLSERADADTVLRTVMTKAHSPKVKTIILCHDAKSSLAIDSGDQNFTSFSALEWRCFSLANSALFPGFTGLVSNLIRSASVPRGRMSRKIDIDGSKSLLQPWQIDFATCSANRVMVSPVPNQLHGLSFTDLAATVYKATNGNAIAVAVVEFPVVSDSKMGRERIDLLQKRFLAKDINSDELRSFAFISSAAAAPLETRSRTRSGSTAADALKGVRSGVTTRDTVPGSILLNPGKDYRVREGQLLILISISDLSGFSVFNGSIFNSSEIPSQLSPGDRQEGYGFSKAETNKIYNAAALAVNNLSGTASEGLAQVLEASTHIHPSHGPSSVSASSHHNRPNSPHTSGATLDEDVEEIVSSERILKPMICLDVRLRTPSVSDHIIISCSCHEGLLMANFIRSRTYLERFGIHPSLIVLLIRVDNLSSCTIDIAKQLLELKDDVVIVRGSADEAEDLNRCSVEFAKSVILTLGGASAIASDATRTHSLTDLEAEGGTPTYKEIAFNYGMLTLLIARIRNRRLIDKQRAEHASRKFLSSLASHRNQAHSETSSRSLSSISSSSEGLSASGTSSLILRRQSSRILYNSYAGPSLIVELRSMEDQNILNAVAQESVHVEKSMNGRTTVIVSKRTTKLSAKVAAVVEAEQRRQKQDEKILSEFSMTLKLHQEEEERVALSAKTATNLLRQIKNNKKDREEIESTIDANLIYTHSIFSEGNAFSNTILYKLMAAGYYNPIGCRFLYELLRPSLLTGSGFLSRIMIPEMYHGNTYFELATILLTEHNAVPIGLHRFGVRERDGEGSPKHYSLLSPPPGTVLYSEKDGADAIFVLSKERVVL
jgi:voltage-gated potassium channel